MNYPEKVRCGGHYCEVCKKCTQQPRLRRYIPDYWHVCEECETDVLHVTFRPREENLMTDFKVKFQDIPLLIRHLIDMRNPLKVKLEKEFNE